MVHPLWRVDGRDLDRNSSQNPARPPAQDLFFVAEQSVGRVSAKYREFVPRLPVEGVVTRIGRQSEQRRHAQEDAGRQHVEFVPRLVGVAKRQRVRLRKASEVLAVWEPRSPACARTLVLGKNVSARHTNKGNVPPQNVGVKRCSHGSAANRGLT
jgi:hypothetical protein